MSAEMEKPPTQRALMEQVAEGVAALVADVETRNSAKATTTAPKPYTEADALRRCIEALEDLKAAEDRGRGARNDYMNIAYMPGEPVGRATWSTGDRILRFLADRFDVALIEVQRPDCQRPHVDSISPDAFLNALGSAVQR